jgi:exopolysaccharide production protein ExoQ
MTTAGHILGANANTHMARGQLVNMPLQKIAGFFFIYRIGLTYLGFQSDPRTGTIVNLTCSGLILVAALLYTIGDGQFSFRFLVSSRTLRWLLAYLAVSGASLFWTAAGSVTDAAGLWTGMAMEVAIVLLLVKPPNATEQLDALMKGFVVGMLFMAAVAWMSPTMPDLRIGNEEFLHPNAIGLGCAMAFFFAQHLALEKRAWRWCCLAFGITLLRSISKTSIVAFAIAETIYLLREKQISRALKIRIAAVAVVVLAVFATLLDTYLTTYTAAGSGNTAETLTGRTLIWSTAMSMAVEHPWIGHGFYSFRALMPAFGTFEAWHAHNELLQQFFEYGLLGVAVTVGLYLSLIFAAKRSAARHYTKLIFVVVLFSLIHGLTEALIFDLAVPLWLLAAFAIVLQQPSQEATA